MSLENLDIRKKIDSANLTYKEIAKRIGITPEYLSRCMSYPLKPEMKSRINMAILGKNYRVLTLEEVIASGDKLMWLQHKSANTPEHYELFPDSPLADSADLRNVCFHSGRIQAKGLYGRQWRCWTEKPSVADAMDWLPK